MRRVGGDPRVCTSLCMWILACFLYRDRYPLGRRSCIPSGTSISPNRFKIYKLVASSPNLGLRISTEKAPFNCWYVSDTDYSWSCEINDLIRERGTSSFFLYMFLSQRHDAIKISVSSLSTPACNPLTRISDKGVGILGCSSFRWRLGARWALRVGI